MQKIDKHIAELLYEHDLVIVPDFGGFLTNYSSAKILSNHTFIPPSKNIVFNKSLKNNDGLLANYISTTETISYPQAIELIEKFVLHLNATLKNGEKVKLEKIGILTMDAERNIQFKPGNTNFFTESFGLAEFQSPAIKQENLSKRIEMGIKKETKKVVNIHTGTNTRRKINYKRVIGIAASVVITVGIVWVSLTTNALKNISYADLNPFTLKAKDTIIVYTRKDVSAEESPAMSRKSTIEDQPAVYDQPISTVVTNVNVEPTKEKEEKTKDVKAIKKNTTSNNLIYHLVAGCFKVEENAHKFVEALQNENIHGSVIGKNNNGLYVVSCGDYSTADEARKNLKTLRKKKSSLWLYKSESK